MINFLFKILLLFFKNDDKVNLFLINMQSSRKFFKHERSFIIIIFSQKN